MEEEQCGESSTRNDDQQPQGGDFLMKELPGNGFNEEYGSEFGYEDLDLMVLDGDLMLDGDQLMNEPQVETGESAITCNVM